MSNKLKELIIKTARDMYKGMDLDGDIVTVDGKKYYVDCLNNELKEIK